MRPDDLQFCTEKSSGVDTLGRFGFGDIVQIDNQNVGVIVRLERDAFQILNANVSVLLTFRELILNELCFNVLFISSSYN